MRIRNLFPISALALVAALAPAAAAQAAGSDEGAFRILLHGRDVGTEEFAIRQTGAGASAVTSATGSVRLRLPDGTLSLTTSLRGSGLQVDPVAYQVDVGGTSPRRVVTTIEGGVVSARIGTGSGERLREYLASSGAVVLDEWVAHHYYFVAARRHMRRLPILMPGENRQVMATLTAAGTEDVEVGGVRVPADRLTLQPADGPAAHVWVDALNRVLRVEIPQRGYVAVRNEVPR